MHYVFVPMGQTVRHKFYLIILQHLHNSNAKEIAGTLAKGQLASLLQNSHKT
jgi:hypothetical protein